MQGVEVAPCSAVFYDSLEKKYPKYTTVDDLSLSDSDMDMFVDLRPYMDTSAFIIHESTSVSRCHKQFRTMGLRHLIVIDNSYSVVGIVTRRDITEKVLHSYWESHGEHIKVYVNVDPLPPAVAYVDNDDEIDSPVKKTAAALDYEYSSSDSEMSNEDGNGINMVGMTNATNKRISTALDEEEY